MHSVEEQLQVQLADRYLLGQLSPEQAEQAERAILADPRLQQRAAQTQKLIAALQAQRAEPAPPPARQDRDWFGLVSSAALVIIAIAGIAWWGTSALLWRDPPSVAAVAEETIAAANVATVELGLTRGASVIPILELEPDQSFAVVALDVGIPETPLYRVQLRGPEGGLLWSTDSARPAEDERIYLAVNTKRLGSGELHFLAQPADGLGNELRLPLQIVYKDQ